MQTSTSSSTIHIVQILHHDAVLRVNIFVCKHLCFYLMGLAQYRGKSSAGGRTNCHRGLNMLLCWNACFVHLLMFVPLLTVNNIMHTILGYPWRSGKSASILPTCCTRSRSCSRFCCLSAFQPRTNKVYLLIIVLLNIICFPSPSDFYFAFKEAMNYEVSFASSFVQVTMLACQAKASDPLFQWHDGICWLVLAFTR